MLPLFGGDAADSRRSRIGRGDWALPKDGSLTRAPEALVRDHREAVEYASRFAEAGKNQPAEG